MTARLTRVHTLPDSALPIAQWVYDALVAQRVLHRDILDRLNAELIPLGIEPISKSGFNRYAMQVMSGTVPRPEVIGPTTTDKIIALHSPER